MKRTFNVLIEREPSISSMNGSKKLSRSVSRTPTANPHACRNHPPNGSQCKSSLQSKPRKRSSHLDYDFFQLSTKGPTHGSGLIKYTCSWDYEVRRDGVVVGAKKTFSTETMSLALEKDGANITATIKKGDAAFSKTFTTTALGE